MIVAVLHKKTTFILKICVSINVEFMKTKFLVRMYRIRVQNPCLEPVFRWNTPMKRPPSVDVPVNPCFVRILLI